LRCLFGKTLLLVEIMIKYDQKRLYNFRLATGRLPFCCAGASNMLQPSVSGKKISEVCF